MLRLLFLSVIILYLVSTLFPIFKIGWLLSGMCFVIVIMTVGKVKKLVRVLGCFFLLLGGWLLCHSGASWQQYILSFGPMLDLLTLFSLVPILGIPIKIGDYNESLKTIIQKKVKTTGQLYMLTSGISYFFSIFMNLATLPMTYYSMKPALPHFPIKEKNRFMSRAITRGFAMPLLWAPVTPIVGIVVTMTGVSWVSILPFVIPLSVMGLFIDWQLGQKKSTQKVEVLNHNEQAATAEGSPTHSPKRVLHILVAILIFNLFMSFFESTFDLSFLILVSILVIPFSLTWSLMIHKGKEYIVQLLDQLKGISITMKDQFFIFLCAGFFISTIHLSKSNEVLNHWVLTLVDAIGAEIFILLLPLIPLALAFIGLHPAVSLSLVAGSLDPSVIGISPHILTVSMLIGAVSSFLVGPYNATLGLMSNILKESSFKVSNWNLSFTSVYIGFSLLYLLVLNMFLG
ncbi:hypothetical protein [Niallia sp. Krafla_26]|uniref:hypothetical protein n=1 Tax=Niallia sp. Krafla_26 TaxID=3064703 RepID=UPI003D17D06C